MLVNILKIAVAAGCFIATAALARKAQTTKEPSKLIPVLGVTALIAGWLLLVGTPAVMSTLVAGFMGTALLAGFLIGELIRVSVLWPCRLFNVATDRAKVLADVATGSIILAAAVYSSSKVMAVLCMAYLIYTLTMTFNTYIKRRSDESLIYGPAT